jgi:hypothetical protein
MKHEDIFIQIVHETSGKSKAELRRVVEAIKRAEPELRAGFEQEIPDEEAQQLLAGLRKEKPGIAKWLLAGVAAARTQQRAMLN